MNLFEKLARWRRSFDVSGDFWIVLPLVILVAALVILRIANRLTRETGADLWSSQTFYALLPILIFSIVLIAIVVGVELVRRARRRAKASREPSDVN
jgi:hypothetical protein